MAETTINSPFFLLFSTSLTLALTTLIVTANTAYPTIPETEETTGTCSQPDELKPIRREVYANGRIFDISHRYTVEMPYSFKRVEGLGRFLWMANSTKTGSLINVSEMRLSAHAGTHVDAPGHIFDHYFDAGFDVDALDLEVLNGPGLLVDVPRDKNITAEVLEALNIPKGVRRVLFRTLNTDRKLMSKTQFDTSYVGFTKEGAKWLVENTDIKLVGTDYLAIAVFEDLYPAHCIFLEGRDIILLEGVKLDDVPAGIYNVHCLPLRLLGAEGSPTRCILIK